MKHFMLGRIQSMVRVITSSGKYDYVKWDMVSHYIETGYVVALA